MKIRLIALFSLLLIAAATAWALSNSILYQLPSVAATPICNSDLGCLGGVTGYTFAAAGSDTNCHPGDPCDGAFTLSLVVTKTIPNEPCHMKTGAGNLNVIWSDNSTTVGTFAFKARDSKTDPCVGGPTVGAVTLGN